MDSNKDTTKKAVMRIARAIEGDQYTFEEWFKGFKILMPDKNAASLAETYTRAGFFRGGTIHPTPNGVIHERPRQRELPLQAANESKAKTKP